MNNTIDSKELQEMKAQLRLLTQKLEQEAIVNEQLIRRSMKDKAYKLRRRIIEESTICLIMIPFFIWILPQLTKISMHFCLFSAAFMALAVCYNYYMYRQFHPKIFTEGNLIEARKATLKFKKLTLRWTYCIGLPFLMVFIPWYIFEKTQFYQGELLKIVLISGSIGFLIGGILGIYQLMKTIRTTDEILRQIEDLEEK